jgi:hypothetical protein
MMRTAGTTARPEQTRRGRAKPGRTGRGGFFHVEVRPARDFIAFRVQDVGRPGGIERVAGRRANGSWDTQKWLIAKDQARIQQGRLVAETASARKVLASLGSPARRVAGDRFKAKPRRDIPESEKPKPAMGRAQREKIRKAQAARPAGRRSRDG